MTDNTNFNLTEPKENAMSFLKNELIMAIYQILQLVHNSQKLGVISVHLEALSENSAIPVGFF